VGILTSKALLSPGCHLLSSLAEATDGSGKLIAIDCWRFTEADDQMLEGPINAGSVEELTHQTFLSIKPQPIEEL
jgi:hypothetical protein